VADYLPFTQSVNNERVGVALEDARYYFFRRWNSRDAAWYMDIRAEDDSAVALGVKLVLGVSLGRRSTHAFFQKHALYVIDTTGQNRDAAYDELGGRVQVLHLSLDDRQNPA
jgi:hypothetical protein